MRQPPHPLLARFPRLVHAESGWRSVFARCFLIGLCLVAGGANCSSDVSAAEPVDFNRDIRPILSNNCLRCHGPDDAHREADLRLDTFEGAVAELGSGGQAIVPGHADESVVVARIESSDPAEKMPPPDSELKLSAKQIDLLKRWIEQGARYDAHWAFQPLRLRTVAAVSRPQWPKSPIDSFVLEELDKHSIAPAPPARRETLLRRVSLDLIGLPPTVEEVRSLAADDRPDAIERRIDRLLASPRYGERWGRHWLDQARYADSNGYTVDSDRSIWPYRDWVIAAVNDDLPFDQFTVDQLAGDLLENPTTEQIIATGFHRNTLVNQEGGTDPEQFRNEAVVDRVNTTGAVWMGLTVGCAQCHNHKYDPFSQREFYQLFAFFNSDEDVNSIAPTLSIPTPAQVTELDALESEIKFVAGAIKELEQVQRLTKNSAPQRSGAGKGASDAADGVADSKANWQLAKAQSLVADRGTEFETLEDGSWLAAGAADPAQQAGEQYLIQTSTELPRLTALRLEALSHESLPANGPGRAKNGNFVLTEIVLKVNDRPVKWTGAQADHSQENYDVAGAIDGDATSGWAINGKPLKSKTSRRGPGDHQAVFYFDAVDVPRGAKLSVSMRFSTKPAGYNLGRFRLQLSGNAAPSAKVDAAPSERLAGELKNLQERKKQLQAKVAGTLVMRQLPKPRDSFIHVRGDFLRHGDPVIPGVPAAVPPAIDAVIDRTIDENAGAQQRPATRLDLARWLISPTNSLVPRVVANRSWSHFFPYGLVETENDFGIQGTPPTHPSLLDWLAIELRDKGWSMKRLHRQIVHSATYQQSSDAREELESIDSNNKLLARQSRLRVEAEIVRDCGLQASGLIESRLGGPSVYPPQPDGVYAFTQNKAAWQTSTGGNRFRRGIYTFFRRSAPYPMLTTFDTPRFDTTCTRRIRSNTPLQSLTLANDQAMLEMATALGQRLWEREGSVADRARSVFEICLSRAPTDQECQSVVAYWSSQAAELEGDPAAAELLLSNLSKEPAWSKLSTGDARRNAERAAWIMVARVMMNLDEFVTRE